MVLRSLAGTFAAIGMLAGVHFYRTPAAVTPRALTPVIADPATMSAEEYHRWQDMAEKANRRVRFKEFENAVVAELGLQECSLQDAVQRIFYYSLYQYPEYLGNVGFAECGATIKIKIAKNVVRGFRIADERHGTHAALIARLEAELHDLACAELVAASMESN